MSLQLSLCICNQAYKLLRKPRGLCWRAPSRDGATRWICVVKRTPRKRSCKAVIFNSKSKLKIFPLTMSGGIVEVKGRKMWQQDDLAVSSATLLRAYDMHITFVIIMQAIILDVVR